MSALREVVRHLGDWSLREPADADEHYRIAEIVAAALIFCVVMLLFWLVLGIDDGTGFHR